MAFANTHKEDPKRILIVDDNPKEVADVIRHLATYVLCASERVPHPGIILDIVTHYHAGNIDPDNDENVLEIGRSFDKNSDVRSGKSELVPNVESTPGLITAAIGLLKNNDYDVVITDHVGRGPLISLGLLSKLVENKIVLPVALRSKSEDVLEDARLVYFLEKLVREVYDKHGQTNELTATDAISVLQAEYGSDEDMPSRVMFLCLKLLKGLKEYVQKGPESLESHAPVVKRFVELIGEEITKDSASDLTEKQRYQRHQNLMGPLLHGGHHFDMIADEVLALYRHEEAYKLPEPIMVATINKSNEQGLNYSFLDLLASETE